MRLKICHKTRYAFDTPVLYGLQQLRKTPKSTHQQNVLSWSTSIEGGKQEVSFEDHHNNHTDLISFDRDAASLTVTSEGEVELTDNHGVLGPHIGPAPLWLYEQPTVRTKPGPGTRALARASEGEGLERLCLGLPDA